jgi:hypothetical protein
VNEPGQPELQCDSLSGWHRVVQLYAGHWDAVSVLATRTAASNQALVRDTHFAALCGRPVVLNSFGAVVHVAGSPCLSGWAPASGEACVPPPSPSWVSTGRALMSKLWLTLGAQQCADVVTVDCE